MNWEDLRYVLAVIREHNLSRAAVSLGVTHTTVGRRVRAIEEQLGVRLFDRTPDGLLPTAAGQDVGDVAERMESDVLSLHGRVLGRDAQLRGKLRVSTMDMFFAAYHGVFASFAQRYPSVELTVATTPDRVSLTRRDADVALRLSNDPPEYLVGRKVGRVEFAVYGSEDLIERVGTDAGYGDYPWIHWDERIDSRWLDTWLAVHAPRARVAMRVDGNTMALRNAIVGGIGVHFLPCFDGDAAPSLRRVGDIDTSFGHDLWLLTMPDLRGNIRVRAFMDHMEQALRAQAGAFAGTEVVNDPGRAVQQDRRLGEGS